jgi:HAMP domain-containing protein
MTEDMLVRIVLAVIVGVLFGIVYCMRVLVLMERRVARIEEHMDNIMHKVLQEEIKIERGYKRKK